MGSVGPTDDPEREERKQGLPYLLMSMLLPPILWRNAASLAERTAIREVCAPFLGSCAALWTISEAVKICSILLLGR